MPDALEVARDTYVDVNIHAADQAELVKRLTQLPDSCAASADCLEQRREVFEQHGVFSPVAIDGTLVELRSYGDRTLRADTADRPQEVAALVERFFHCG